MTILIIVGGSDPIYELDLDAGGKRGQSLARTHTHKRFKADHPPTPPSLPPIPLPGRNRSASQSYLHQFVAHAALDVIDNLMWVNDSCFLRVVDKFDTTIVSAYVSVGGHYLLLLHEGKEEDQVHFFFKEVHDVLSRYLLNPFVEPDCAITSADFDTKIGYLAKRIFAN